MYKKIKNPITGKQININSKLGKNILKMYMQYGGNNQINIFSHNILSNEFVSHITGRHENFINQNKRYNKILDCMGINNSPDCGKNNIFLLQEVEPYFLRLLQSRNKNFKYVFSNKCFKEALGNMGFVGEYDIERDAREGTNCAIIWNFRYFIDKSDPYLKKVMQNTICDNDPNVYSRKSSAIVCLEHICTGKNFIFASFHRAGNDPTKIIKNDIIQDIVSYFNQPIYNGYIKILGGDANSNILTTSSNDFKLDVLEKYEVYPYEFLHKLPLTTPSHDYHEKRFSELIDYVLVNQESLKESNITINENIEFEGSQYSHCGNEIDIKSILEDEPEKRNKILYNLAVPRKGLPLGYGSDHFPISISIII